MVTTCGEVTLDMGADCTPAPAGMVLATKALSSRDALHVAVMVREGISRIMTFDQGCDRVPGIHRLGG